MKPVPENTNRDAEHKLRSTLFLLKDLQNFGPPDKSLATFEKHCARIAKDLEACLGTVEKRKDPKRYEKLHSALKTARNLKNKAKSAGKRRDHAPSAALLYSYGSLFGQLVETLNP